MAILGRKVENEYIGVLSGIMDQFVIAHGKKDNALLLNTGSLEFVYTPLELGAYSLVVVNTNKKRGLADSKYNERYSETMAALGVLQQTYKIDYLTELTPNDLPEIERMILGVCDIITSKKRFNAQQKRGYFNFSIFKRLIHKNVK